MLVADIIEHVVLAFPETGKARAAREHRRDITLLNASYISMVISNRRPKQHHRICKNYCLALLPGKGS